MADGYLVIPVPPAAADSSGIDAESASSLSVEWVDAEGAQVGTRLVIRPPRPAMAETFGVLEGPFWHSTRADVVLPGEPPAGAVRARVAGSGFATIDLPLAEVARRTLGRPDADPLRHGDPAAPWKLVIVADGYESLEVFATDFAEFVRDFDGARPFAELLAEGLVGVTGLFWKAVQGQSLFDARKRDNNPWIIYGNDEAVNSAVAASEEPGSKVLVVMNRPERGGAGGFSDTRPSWTTNVDGLNERWPQIALHELGHAFGLADEYETEGNGTPEPNPLEVNVSREMDPEKVTWQTHVTLDNGAIPSLRSGLDTPYNREDIGTFEGARYSSTQFCRPSYGCRMRWTTWQFCGVCAEAIADHVRQHATSVHA